MEEIQCQRVTRYLAKLYLDAYLLSAKAVPTSQLQRFGISSIKLAVKVHPHSIQFNESFEYPVAQAQQSTGMQYSRQEILDGEDTLMLTMKFKMRLSTPYCYIKNVRELVPISDEILFNQLEMLVEYCTMLPELVGYSSGEVLFAILLYLCKLRNITQQVQQIVLALAARWPNLEQTSELIRVRLEQDNATLALDS